MLIAVSLTAVFAVLAGGAWFLSRDAPEEPPRSLPARWPSADGEAVRRVPMPTGEMVAALPPATAGHVLCGAVPEASWASVLGGPVLREATKYGECHVVTADLEVSAGMWSEPPLTGGDATELEVAGHGATLTRTTTQHPIDAMLTVRLSDSTQDWVKPQLQIRVSAQPGVRTEPDFGGMATALGTAMVAAVATPGPSLPTRDERAHEMTPIPGSGIGDAAYPLITWQLCTQLSRASNTPLDQLRPGLFGSCERKEELKTITLAYHDKSDGSFPDRLAGRPAREKTPDTTAEIQLLDDSHQTLEITWTDSTKPGNALHDLAEKVVPPLLGR